MNQVSEVHSLKSNYSAAVAACALWWDVAGRWNIRGYHEAGDQQASSDIERLLLVEHLERQAADSACSALRWLKPFTCRCRSGPKSLQREPALPQTAAETGQQVAGNDGGTTLRAVTYGRVEGRELPGWRTWSRGCVLAARSCRTALEQAAETIEDGCSLPVRHSLRGPPS